MRSTCCPKDWARREAKDPAGWEDSVRCMDVDNANKVLIDALEGILFDDDRSIWRVTTERGEPRAEAGCMVRVEPYV